MEPRRRPAHTSDGDDRGRGGARRSDGRRYRDDSDGDEGLDDGRKYRRIFLSSELPSDGGARSGGRSDNSWADAIQESAQQLISHSENLERISLMNDRSHFREKFNSSMTHR
jgi:hypothetical protein